jgi:hypothetical protein
MDGAARDEELAASLERLKKVVDLDAKRGSARGSQDDKMASRNLARFFAPEVLTDPMNKFQPRSSVAQFQRQMHF